jgi:hypothetical protein
MRKTHALPYALQEGGRLRPTVLAQAMARFPRHPTPRIDCCWVPEQGPIWRTGALCRSRLAGEFAVDAQQTVPEVDALNLMTVEMADALSAAGQTASQRRQNHRDRHR